jgi:hypothetical protein
LLAKLSATVTLGGTTRNRNNYICVEQGDQGKYNGDSCMHRHLKIIDCLSLFTVPATSAAQNSLLFFFFLLRLLTELISKQGRP